jgi:aminopeptidase N
MRSEEPRTIRLAEYAPPDYLIDSVEFDFKLDPSATIVTAELSLKPNPAGRAGAPLALDGDGLVLDAPPLLDNEALPDDAFAATPDGLTLHRPPQRPFRLRIRTRLDPSGNTQLMGLYRSSGTYCTQCEAEGFRRITYFLDRPDVLATYHVRIEADRKAAPVLLSNGNLVSEGALDGGRHFAVWHDPFPKPSYLFALVGGDLGVVEGRFVTMSGREVKLGIHVEHGKEARAAYAMDALKRAMRWDEETFGREYDLDVFNIVAVSDFNMGAMENKGLNVFNDKYILASPETATDGDYAGIEAVIAHEYFHNWTGDRITCRDWFQLCLKEGLTVFRDQEFSSDQRSRPVKRISDVRTLRAQQFTEDAGPFAHPVRPDNYREINNFYTATVYEKGAEVVRMLKTLLGAEQFRRGMDLYFERHDGEAATVEDFVACFADVSGRDLRGQFMRWYSQAGTPEVAVQDSFEAAGGRYILDLAQTVAPTPGQPDKEPLVIPLALGLIGPDGAERPLRLEGGSAPPNGVIELTERRQRLVFTGLDARPVPSLNRGFSAPIRITSDLSDDDLLFLARHDQEPFARWQALQTVATRLLIRAVAAVRQGQAAPAEPRLASALGAALENQEFDPAYRAQLLALPSEADIAREIGTDVDPDAIHAAREACRRSIGRTLAASLAAVYSGLAGSGPYSPDARSAGRRALRAAVLDLLAAAGDDEGRARAEAHYRGADNMTDRMAGLAVLAGIDHPAREDALADFYHRYTGDALVLDKWFVLQATIAEPGTLDRVKRLTSHEAFSFANPNRLRALIGAFAAANPTQFNRPDGAGHAYIADTVLAIDGRNPQVAARLLGAFRSWKTLEPVRRAHAEAALRRVAAAPKLSRDVADLAGRALA